jgi:hypothetical protein
MKMLRKSREIHKVTIGDGPVFLPGIIAVARRGVPVVVSKGNAFRKRMETSRQLLYTAMEADIEALARQISIAGFPKGR